MKKLVVRRFYNKSFLRFVLRGSNIVSFILGSSFSYRRLKRFMYYFNFLKRAKQKKVCLPRRYRLVRFKKTRKNFLYVNFFCLKKLRLLFLRLFLFIKVKYIFIIYLKRKIL